VNRRRIIALTTAMVVLGGGAVAVVEFVVGGGDSGDSGGHSASDPARLRSDITGKLPAGWSATVDRDGGGTVNIRLVHKGGMKELMDAVRSQKIVNPDEPEMMRLLPPHPEGTAYLFHYSDTKDKGTLMRFAAGKGYSGPHPVLKFMSRDLINYEIKQGPKPTATSVVIPIDPNG
jgi:hypothetical protein